MKHPAEQLPSQRILTQIEFNPIFRGEGNKERKENIRECRQKKLQNIVFFHLIWLG